MPESVFALPVSVEQIAAVIKRMRPVDKQRLLNLVPDLRRIATQPSSRTVEQARATVAHVQTEVLATLQNQPLSPDEPFLGKFTLGQYHALSDEEKTRLWDEWAAGIDVMEFKEREISPDALPAG